MAINPPDFVIAGSAKSGTTALDLMLDQHDAVYMSQIKETNYFVHGYEPTRHFVAHHGRRVLAGIAESDIIDDPQKYLGVFDAAPPGVMLGEASPWYLINPAVPDRLLGQRPDVKVVVILRNPTDVAFANFVHLVRVGGESLTLDEVDQIFESSHYDQPNLYPFSHHLNLPRYSSHLPVWLEKIPAGQMHLMIYEEFRQDRDAALAALLEFLGLPGKTDIATERRVNVSGMPRSRMIQDLIQGSLLLKKTVGRLIPKKPRRKLRDYLEALNTGPRVTMPEEIRSRFDGLYTSDIAYVEQVFGRRIGHWRALRGE